MTYIYATEKFPEQCIGDNEIKKSAFFSLKYPRSVVLLVKIF